MEYKKSTYKKQYKKAETAKTAYKPKRGNTDGEWFTVHDSRFMIQLRLKIND